MAAEKLTIARLMQILIILVVLIFAFTWRTFEHYHQQNNIYSCKLEQTCKITTQKDHKLSIFFNKPTSDKLTIDLIEKTPSIFVSIASKSLNLSKQAFTTEHNLSVAHYEPLQSLHFELEIEEEKIRLMIE